MLGVGEGDIGEVDDDAVLRLRLEKCDDLQVVPRNPAASRSGSSRYRTSKKKKNRVQLMRQERRQVLLGGDAVPAQPEVLLCNQASEKSSQPSNYLIWRECHI